jgi:competence protein ComEC
VSLIVFFTMWSGFLMLAVGAVFPMVGAALGAFCSATIGCLESVVDWADLVPAGHFWAPGPAWWWVAVFYVGLLAVMVRRELITSVRWQVAALSVWILVGLAPPMARYWTRSELACSFVSVGHGACVLVETPDGKTFMYDAGAIGSPEYATQTIASYLWHRGIMRIDALLISHADIDHYNAVPGLLERFRIGTVYVSPVMFSGFGEDGTITGAKVLRDAIERAGVPIRETWSGDRLTLGRDVTAQVFHPPARGVVGNDNANSVTLGIEYAHKRLLLPGDLESPGIDDVMAEEPYDCDVLLAPHHGSRRSDPPGFASWSTPQWVVVSGGGGDETTTVKRSYERVGGRVLSTIDAGTVRFDVHYQGGLEVITWRPDEGG